MEFPLSELVCAITGNHILESSYIFLLMSRELNQYSGILDLWLLQFPTPSFEIVPELYLGVMLQIYHLKLGTPQSLICILTSCVFL